MLHAYGPPPEPPKMEDREAITAYGSRLVLYLIQHETCARLDDRQLETADYAITELLQRRKRGNEEISPVYFRALDECRQMIRISQKGRKEERDRKIAALQPPNLPSIPPQPGRNGGETEPRTPAPQTNPPAPAAAVPARAPRVQTTIGTVNRPPANWQPAPIPDNF